MKIDYMQAGAGLLVGYIAGYMIAKKYATPATPAPGGCGLGVPSPRFAGQIGRYTAPRHPVSRPVNSGLPTSMR